MENNKKDNEKSKKQYYLVEVEAMIPTILKYRVLAEDPEEAFKIVKESNTSPLLAPPKPLLQRMKKVSAKIYNYGTHMLRLTKSFK